LNQNVTLNCITSSSNPPAKLIWLLDENLVQKSTTDVKSDGKYGWIVTSTLTIPIVNHNSSVKTFTCQVQNSKFRDNIFATHKINVICKSSFFGFSKKFK